MSLFKGISIISQSATFLFQVVELQKMLNMFFVLKVFSFILSLIICSTAQRPATPGLVAYDNVCQRKQGLPDNLSCFRDDGLLQCLLKSQLCDGTKDCANGYDEGVRYYGYNSLDCK